MIAKIALVVALVFVSSLCVILFLANMQLTSRRKLLMTEDVVALAEHLMSEREYQKAFEALDIAKKSHRCLETCLLLYGTLNVKMGNYLEGLHYCKEVTQADQCYAKALDCTAEAYLQLKDYKKANSEFRLALHCNPGDSYALLGLSSLELEKKEYPSVIELLTPFEDKYVTVVRALRPSSSAGLMTSSGGGEAVLRAPAFLLYAHEDQLAAEILYNLASALAGSKRNFAAIAMLEDIITAVPTHVIAYKALHELLSNENQHEKALAISRTLAGQLPLSSVGHALMGKSLLELRRAPEAIATLQVAVLVEQETASNVKLLHSLGVALESVGELKEASSVLTRATDILTKDCHHGLQLNQHHLVETSFSSPFSSSEVDTAEQTDHRHYSASTATAAAGNIDLETMRLVYGAMGRVQSRLGQWHTAYVALLRSVSICGRCSGQGEVWMALGVAQRKLGLYQDSQRSFMEASFFPEEEAAALRELAQPRESESEPSTSTDTPTMILVSKTNLTADKGKEGASARKRSDNSDQEEGVKGKDRSHASAAVVSEEASKAVLISSVSPLSSEDGIESIGGVPTVKVFMGQPTTTPEPGAVEDAAAAAHFAALPPAAAIASITTTELSEGVVAAAEPSEEGIEAEQDQDYSGVQDAVPMSVGGEAAKEQETSQPEQEVSQVATADVPETTVESITAADDDAAASVSIPVVHNEEAVILDVEAQADTSTGDDDHLTVRVPTEEQAEQEVASVAVSCEESEGESEKEKGSSSSSSDHGSLDTTVSSTASLNDEEVLVDSEAGQAVEKWGDGVLVAVAPGDDDQEDEDSTAAVSTEGEGDDVDLDADVDRVVSDEESPINSAAVAVVAVAVPTITNTVLGFIADEDVTLPSPELALASTDADAAAADDDDDSSTTSDLLGVELSVVVEAEVSAAVDTSASTKAAVAGEVPTTAHAVVTETAATSTGSAEGSSADSAESSSSSSDEVTTQDSSAPAGLSSAPDAAAVAATPPAPATVPEKPTPSPTAVRVASQYITLSNAYMGRGLVELAVKQLHKAAKKAPEYADVYILRGNALLELGQLVEAAEDFVKVATLLDLGNATAYDNAALIGVQLLRAGQIENAIKILLPLFRYNSSDTQVSQPLAQSLASVAGKEELALEVFSQFDGRVRRALGLASVPATATAAATVVVSDDTGNETTTGNEITGSGAETDDDSSTVNISIEERPLTAQTVHMLAGLFEKTNRSELAEQLWVEAIGKNLSSWSDLGDLQQRQERYSDAAKSFEKAIEVIMEPYRPTPPPLPAPADETEHVLAPSSPSSPISVANDTVHQTAEGGLTEVSVLDSEGATVTATAAAEGTEGEAPVSEAELLPVEVPVTVAPRSSLFGRGRRGGGDFSHHARSAGGDAGQHIATPPPAPPVPKTPSAAERRRLAILHYKLGALYYKYLSDMSRAAGHYEAAMDYGVMDKEMRRFFSAYERAKAQTEGRILPDDDFVEADTRGTVNVPDSAVAVPNVTTRTDIPVIGGADGSGIVAGNNETISADAGTATVMYSEDGSVIPVLAAATTAENSSDENDQTAVTADVATAHETISAEHLLQLEEEREARLSKAEAGSIPNGVAKRGGLNRNRWLVWGNVDQKQLNAKFPYRRKEAIIGGGAGAGGRRMGGDAGSATSDAELSGLASSLGLPSMDAEAQKESAFESQVRQQEEVQEQEEQLEQAERERFTHSTVGSHGAFPSGIGGGELEEQFGDMGLGNGNNVGDLSSLLGSLGGAYEDLK